MSDRAGLVFDGVALVFLALTVIVGLIVIGVVTGAMEPPILAPQDTPIPATVMAPPTLTPSPAPTLEQVGELTPETTAQETPVD